jgi:hypothetical protein
MIVDPKLVKPSQDFLKPQTVEFIFSCLKNETPESLPPSPIVRRDEQNNLVAIDGHNLLAVYAFLGRPVEVHVAESGDDGIHCKTESDVARNAELKAKFDTCLVESRRLDSTGLQTIADLTEKYDQLMQQCSLR